MGRAIDNPSAILVCFERQEDLKTLDDLLARTPRPKSRTLAVKHRSVLVTDTRICAAPYLDLSPRPWRSERRRPQARVGRQ
jgi:hypothetical protein